MNKLLCKVSLTAALALMALNQAWAQPEGWTRPYPGFQIIGNLYGVGTYDLSVFLITTDEGHILINTGLEDSTAMIRDNMASLGFELEDVAILLTQQAHWDHTAALAEIKQIAGAEMWATADDARVLEDGGFSDPHFGGRVSFPPVTVDRILGEGDVIELGGVSLSVYEHPGHTEGSSSYAMTVRENGRDYRVLIANMGTINDGKQLVVDPTYPRRGRGFRRNLYRPESHGNRRLGSRPRRPVRPPRQVPTRPGLQPRHLRRP